MDETFELLKKLKTENFIWIIYLGVIGLCFYSNYLEANYLKFRDLASKSKYRETLLIIFSVVLIVYFYFFIDAYDGVKKLNRYDSNKKKVLTEANYLASFLMVVVGIIFLVIAIVDDDLDVELAFS